MTLQTISLPATFLFLVLYLALTATRKKHAHAPPDAQLRHVAARAMLVLLATATTLIGWPESVVATALLSIMWIAASTTGHSLLEDLAVYQSGIRSDPLPGDFE